MKSLFQILFLNLKNNKVSSFKLGQDITKKLRSSKIHFQTTSKRKPDFLGTAATSCKKFTQTADIPIFTPIPTATTLGTSTQPDQHGNKYSLKNAHKKEKLCI